MSATYTPNAADALFKSFTGVPFDDPIAYSAANNKRIDSKFFLKPIQDEVLNLIAIAATGGGALPVRNETGLTLSAGPVRISGYNAANNCFKISAANATGAQAAHAMLAAPLANNTNGTAYIAGLLSAALNTSGAAAGDPVYLAVGGGLTLTAPSAADQIVQRVGRVKTVAVGGDVAGLIEAPSAFGTSFLQNDAVTDAKLRNSAATSVIGRAANSSGDPADIAAGADGEVLRRAAGALSFGTLATANYADGSITPIKLDSSAIDNSMCCGRLTTESGVAASPADRTAQSTLYFTPFRGNRVSLYDGSRWKMYSLSEISMALSGLNPGGIYDVFLYDNSGALTLEALQWSNSSAAITAATGSGAVVQVTSNGHGLANGERVWINGMAGNTAGNDRAWIVQNVAANTFELTGSLGNGTYTSGGTWRKMGVARATSLVLQDGVYVKSGATTRRYLGTFIATAANATEDSAQRRYVWNAGHRVERTIKIIDASSGNHTYSTPTFRFFNSDGRNCVEAIVGLPESIVALFAGVIVKCTASNSDTIVGIGVNAAAANSADVVGYGAAAAANVYTQLSANTRYQVASAGHFIFPWLQYAATATTTWQASATIPGGITGLIHN